jgi:hypothetical protein
MIYDFAEPIVAWRRWQISCVDNRLYSLGGFEAEPWSRDGVLIAECKNHLYWKTLGPLLIRPCRKCPSKPTKLQVKMHTGHGCGIYAFKEPPKYADLDGDVFENYILGKVHLAGRIYEYTEGYRAERAKVAALCAPAHSEFLTKAAHRIAKAYDVPVIEDPRIRVERGTWRLKRL